MRLLKLLEAHCVHAEPLDPQHLGQGHVETYDRVEDGEYVEDCEGGEQCATGR